MSLYLVDPAGDDLTQVMEVYRRSMVAAGCTAVTVNERMMGVRALGKHSGIDPRHARVDELIGWLARPELAPASRATYFAHLRSWFGWLARTGRRADDPTEAMKAPRVGRSAPRPLGESEVTALLAGASPRMKTWLTLGLYAGLRAHEIAKIRGHDIRQDTLFVLGKGGHQAELPTHPSVWAEAQRQPAGYWFPSSSSRGHIRPETVSHTSSLYFTSLGIDGAIHRCRHTYATKLLRAGVNIRVVQQLMRHETLQTTARYTAVFEVDMRDAVMRLAPIDEDKP